MIPSASHVASLYLKHAGLLEPPPAMLAAIMRWLMKDGFNEKRLGGDPWDFYVDKKLFPVDLTGSRYAKLESQMSLNLEKAKSTGTRLEGLPIEGPLKGKADQIIVVRNYDSLNHNGYWIKDRWELGVTLPTYFFPPE